MFEAEIQRLYNDVGPFGVALLAVPVLLALIRIVWGLYDFYKNYRND